MKNKYAGKCTLCGERVEAGAGVYERGSVKHVGGCNAAAAPKPSSSFEPTVEQRAAVALFETGKSIAIEAGAGTGKTSTLVLIAEAAERLGKRGAYVAFNKSIATEAGSKMPGNVTASTAHSLAFRAVGRQYSHRLNAPRMKSMEIARRLRIDPIVIRYGAESKPLAAGYLAGYVMRGVARFCQSADLEPNETHFPYIDGIDVPAGDGKRGMANNNEVRRAMLPAMRRAWADIADLHGQLPFKHEHYLKLWHLSGPKIEADFILFDEAQDANPVLVAIVTAQKHAQIVWVGDSQQQIYMFTGAINALASVPADARTFLTQSFRFGPAIADVANDVLDLLGAQLRIIGTPAIASVVGPIAEPDAILCRTNARAMKTVLELLRDGRKPALIGGGTEIASFAAAAKQLMNDEPTSHPELACFSTWGEVQDYVEYDEQGDELRLLVDLVDEFGVDTILDGLGKAADESRCDVVVSTAHKAKGREWNSVQLASDFPDEERLLAGETSFDDLRLLYVAATRAKRELDVTNVPLLDPDAQAPESPAALLTSETAAQPAESGSCCLHADDRHGAAVCCLHADRSECGRLGSTVQS